ncbi:hypothetical protein GHV40_13800 [Devosia sp. D6-9]|nr:hypothetical protein GHV40_13800 [Devosia sp. D6-9]
MRYTVLLRYRPEEGRRSLDHPPKSDHQVEGDISLLPNLGDHIHLESMGGEDEPSFDGIVAERHFRYRGGDSCEVEIVVGPFHAKAEEAQRLGLRA